MRCVECGANMDDDALFCPECGANPHLHPVKKSGCRRLLPFVWGALALVVALFLLSLAAWRGMVEGRKQWQSNAEATADAEFARCQDYLSQGNWALAAAACREADRLKPEYTGAAAGYATAVAALTPQPTPTIELIERAVDDIFVEAQKRFGAQDWHGTLEALNEIWQLDSAFNADQVNDMRHTALVSLGQEALSAGRLEEAIYYLDQAVAFGPLDAALETERQLAARYVSALNFCGASWEECTDRLAELYAAYPDYRDVFDQLVNAYLEWADTMATLQEWCPAEVRYAQALRLRPGTEVETKRADAAQRCLLATPTPVSGQITGTVPLRIEGFNVGRLTYPAYNGDLGVYELFTISASDQQLSKTASNASQPAWRRDGTMLAYRGILGLQAIPASGGDPLTLVNDSSAFWPTWSPDGARLAYARQETDGWRIYTTAVDGSSNPQPLISGKYPLWGPQGALAFSGCIVENTPRGICVVDPNDLSGVPVPLTADPNDIPVSWAPDGGNIAYMSNHGGDWDVYLVSTSGGVAVLTVDDELPASDGLPTWAPDGSGIAFVSNREGSWQLFLMAPDGSAVRKILDIGGQHPNFHLERLSWGP